MLNAFGSDLVFAMRLVARAPGFAATAIVTLALGIGVTTAVYSLVDGVLLRPFLLPHPQQLMAADRGGMTLRGPIIWTGRHRIIPSAEWQP
jgi:hypothetical protein